MIMEGVSDAMLKGEWIKGKWEELLFLVNLHWMGLFAEVGYHYLAVNQKIRSEESFTKAPLMWQWKDIFAENLIHKKLICYTTYLTMQLGLWPNAACAIISQLNQCLLLSQCISS